jgi:hypothetical protein
MPTPERSAPISAWSCRHCHFPKANHPAWEKDRIFQWNQWVIKDFGLLFQRGDRGGWVFHLLSINSKLRMGNMKTAVIIVGKHGAGKSLTINKHLKRNLKNWKGKPLGPKKHIFKLGDKWGFILSQSFEESDRDVETTIKKYSGYDLLVLAAHPKGDSFGSVLQEMIQALSKQHFKAKQVKIISKHEAPQKAQVILKLLKSTIH